MRCGLREVIGHEAIARRSARAGVGCRGPRVPRIGANRAALRLAPTDARISSEAAEAARRVRRHRPQRGLMY